MTKKIQFLNFLIQIWQSLNFKRRNQFYGLILISITCAIAEVFCLASVIPFISIISNPNILNNNTIVSNIRLIFNLESSDDLILLLTILFIITTLLAVVFRVGTLWVNGRFAASLGSELSYLAYKKTILQPYEVHINRNSNEILAAITTYTKVLISNINNILQLISSFIISLFILLTIFFVNYKISLIIIVVFGIFYSIIIINVQNKLKSNSRKIVLKNNQRIKVLQESLGFVEHMILDKKSKYFLEKFKNSEYELRTRQVENIFIASSPRFVIEGIAILIITLVAYFFTKTNEDNGISIFPFLGLVALSAQRLSPLIQQGYAAFSSLSSSYYQAKVILNLLNQEIPKENFENFSYKYRSFKHKVEFKDIYFNYENTDIDIIKNCNFSIYKGERIGIIGETGGGKSTLVKILMGLLKPSKGNIYLDSFNLHGGNSEQLMSWHRDISYVPQDLFLSDSTIAENIAFGQNYKDIDLKKLNKVILKSRLKALINTLPEGINTLVGERGIKLSGGQIQRLGIARALYKKSKIIIFDESTSALDVENEKLVIEDIYNLGKNITIVFVAHRLSTLYKCDYLLEIKNCKVKKIYNYLRDK